MTDGSDTHAVVPRGFDALDVPEARAQAFRVLTQRRLDQACRLASAILDNAAEGEDAVHDACVQAWRSWLTLRDPERFEPWFDRIVVNTCRNRLRARSRAHVEDISAEIGLAQPGDAYGAAHDRDEVRSALARLDPDHRVVVALRFFADLTIDDIAARTGVPAGTVKSRLHHGLRRLRAAMDAAAAREVTR